MFAKLEKVAVQEIQTVMNLLVEKFRLDKERVSFQFNNQNPSLFKVRFLNQTRSIDDGKVDDEFFKPVKLLESYDGVCVLEPNENDASFYALIMLSTSELPDLKQSLEWLNPIDDDEVQEQNRRVFGC